MSRPKESHKKVDVSRAAAPLQQNPFALLGELDALLAAPLPDETPAAWHILRTARAEAVAIMADVH